MTGVRGLLNIQSLNELTYEKRETVRSKFPPMSLDDDTPGRNCRLPSRRILCSYGAASTLVS